MIISNSKEAVLSAILIAAGVLPFSANAEVNSNLPNATLRANFSLQNNFAAGQKLASVCFINDTENCLGYEFGNSENLNNTTPPDYDLDDADRCRREGYTLSSCSNGKIPTNFCIYNNNFFEKCTCPAGYKTCEPPYYGVGTACGDSYPSCEKDAERACKELDPNYTDSCPSGWQLSPDNRCPYDESFGICCNLCKGYDYTTIPNGYIADGEACVSCDGITKYKIKINPCDGFLDCGSMGPASGAKSCQSGSQTKYDNCKPCPNLGTYTTCPSPYTCAYEECSNRYYKTGCQSGYDWDASTQTCTSQCDSAYKYSCTGIGYDYGIGDSCNGKYTKCSCSYPYSWSGSGCSCSSSYRYSCVGTGYDGGSGTSCNGKYSSCYCSSGYIWDGSQCVACTPAADETNCLYGTEYCSDGCGGSRLCCKDIDLCEGVVCGENEQCNSYSGQCVCKTSFKYTCDENQCVSPVGPSCGGKYEACSCSCAIYCTGPGETPQLVDNPNFTYKWENNTCEAYHSSAGEVAVFCIVE